MRKIAIHCAHTGMADPRQLRPNPQNPKRHGKRKVALYAKIIKEGGWRRAIVVSQRSGLIVSGHGAQLAALQLGLPKVPIDKQQFPSAEAEKAAMLADNWLAESMADYDQELIAEIVDELREAHFDTELAGVMTAIEEDEVRELKRLEVLPVPRMAWVLIGVPTKKFGRINALVEKIARVDGVQVETTANNQFGENGEED